MMRFRVLLLMILVMACVVRVQAGPTPPDPRLIINNTHYAPDGACTSITSLSFNFSANDSGGGSFCFINNTTEDWSFLEFATPSPDPLGCHYLRRSSCSPLV